MTVSAVGFSGPTWVQLPGNGASTNFSFPFLITAATDLVVGFITSGVYGSPTAYTIACVYPGNGQIIFATPPPSGTTVDIRSAIPETQPTNFANLGGYYPENTTNSVDRLTRQIQDLYRLTYQFAIHAPDQEGTPWTALPTAAARANTALLFDVNGLPTVGILTAQTFTQPLFNAFLAGSPPYAITPTETANGITPANLNYAPGYVQRYGANDDSGVTNNQTPFQQALTASAGYCPVIIQGPGGYFGGFTAPLNVPANSHIIFIDNAEVRFASTAALGPLIGGIATRPGLNLMGSNIRIEGLGVISGPSVGTYTGAEIGIVAVGTSAASPYTSILIRGIEVRWWGSDGIELKWCSLVRTEDNYVHDCGYAGMHYLSCTDVAVTKNQVGPITPGASGNAYGISFTWDAAGGVNSGSRNDPNHYCIGVECSGNFVHDIPLWLGIDSHGGFDIDIHDNRVYNCWTGIQIGAGSVTAPPGENNSISFNTVNISQYNGAATTVASANPIGVTFQGASLSLLQVGARCIGNLIEGYG